MPELPRQVAPGLLQTTHVVVLELQFSAEQIRAQLPPGLEPADSNDGFLLTFTAEGPDADPPRSGAFLSVYLKGRDAPDGSPGIFVTDGYYGFSLDEARQYSTRFGPGHVDMQIAPDQIAVGLHREGADLLRLSMRIRTDLRVLNMGTHQYFGLRPGGLTTYSIAFSAPILEGDLLSLTVGENAPPLLAGLTAAQVRAVSYAPGAALVFSRQRDIAQHEPITSADSAHMAILEVLASVGRAAVVVDIAGRVLFGNAKGMAALKPMLRGEMLTGNSATEQDRLLKLIGDAALVQRGKVGERVALHRPDGTTVLVQAGTYRGGWRGVATALLLIYDPRAEAQIGPVEGLELLGLTPAEARIAAAIGQGLSARSASETLLLSENTIRSTLKSIYAKLGLSNRTQLGALVADLRLPRE